MIQLLSARKYKGCFLPHPADLEHHGLRSYTQGIGKEEDGCCKMRFEAVGSWG